MKHTMTSLNIAMPLTLHTGPSEYATFKQIKSILLFNIGLLLERENKQNVFRSGFWQKLENVVKNFLTVISNGQGFKLFPLNQVIDEVTC